MATSTTGAPMTTVNICAEEGRGTDTSIKRLAGKLEGMEIMKRGAPVHEEATNPGSKSRISTSNFAHVCGDTSDKIDEDDNSTDGVWMIPRQRRVGNKIATVLVPCTITRQMLYGKVTRTSTTGKIVVWRQA